MIRTVEIVAMVCGFAALIAAVWAMFVTRGRNRDNFKDEMKIRQEVLEETLQTYIHRMDNIDAKKAEELKAATPEWAQPPAESDGVDDGVDDGSKS